MAASSGMFWSAKWRSLLRGRRLKPGLKTKGVKFSRNAYPFPSRPGCTEALSFSPTMNRRTLLPLVLAPLIAHAGADWPQWRGPERNGVLTSGPKLAETAPPDGFPSLWESEMIPSNDEGGLSSPVIAGGRVYMSVVWHSDVPSETRQIGELA
jgi:hypothetical protein